MSDIKKAIIKKNTKIEKVFAQALPDVTKFEIDYLTPREYYHVFLFLECKSASEEQIRDILREFLSEDENGKFSMKEFIKEFKESQQIESQNPRRGRRLYTNVNDILKRIAFVISGRGLKNFGSLLADQDLEGKLSIERDAFYRTVDSLQFGLGEGDILELIKNYACGNNQVDI